MTGKSFWKYHGIGNDFVVIDRIRGGRPTGAPEAVEMCDRNRGIGADGVLTLLPSEGASFRMHIRNADGSVAEMCGNGVRCAVKFALEHSDVSSTGGKEALHRMSETGLLPSSRSVVRALNVETGRGVLECLAETRGGRVTSVAVDMGAPMLDRPSIPMKGAGRFLEGTVKVPGKRFKGTAVGMGNPHLVLFHKDDLQDAVRFGPVLERSPLFPRRTNVEFARSVSPRKIRVVVWERGVGITQACGTGACATAVAFVLAGLAPFGKELSIMLPGGTLGVAVPSDLHAVFMRGPAEEVFTGTW